MPTPAPVELAPWQPWQVPRHLRVGEGGWCVVQGEPNERVAVNRQVRGVPDLTREEAEAIAAALNAVTPAPAEAEMEVTDG